MADQGALQRLAIDLQKARQLDQKLAEEASAEPTSAKQFPPSEPKPQEKPYEPFGLELPEEAPPQMPEKIEKETGNEEEREKKRAVNFATAKRKIQLETLRQQKEIKKQEKLKTEQKTGKVKKFTGFAFGLWFGAAIVADIGSLIPYVGVIISWPFVFLFFIYKRYKKLNMAKSVTVSSLDFIFESLLSTLPVNMADVLMTYALSRNEMVAPSTQETKVETKKTTGDTINRKVIQRTR